jgi:outer membrane protein assembly factor BamB
MEPVMSTVTAAGPKGIEAHAAESKAMPASRLRVWPAVVMLAIFWAFLYANHTFEMTMFGRFLSRMAGYGVLLVAFLGWWLSRSAVRWRDRLLAIVVVAVIYVIACWLSDKSMDPFAIFMSAFPIVFTVWTAWLLVSRSASPIVQRAGFCAAMLLAFGYFTLVRWDGLDAAQRAEMSWRWSPTKEQQFLASRGAEMKHAEKTITKQWAPQPGDCLEYRGSRRDGVISGTALDTDWQAHLPKLAWRKKVGPAWSGMIVVDSHVVTQEQRGDVEVVACYDAATGDEIWVHEEPARFEETLSGAGPRGTPTFSEGRIYSFGAKAKLNCLKAETGAVIWSHDSVADAGVEPADMPVWGYSVSPLIVDGLVIVFAGGGQGKSVLAYQASNGNLAWTRAGGKQSYSSPQLVTLHDLKQIVMHDNRALMGLNIANGNLLWEFPNSSEMSLPMLQPHAVENNKLAISTEPGAALIAVKRDGDKWSADADWTIKDFKASFSDFVIAQGCIFGLSNGVLCCFDLTNGERLWKKGRLGAGQLLSLEDQGLLLVSSEKGEVILVAADRGGYQELGRIQAIEGKTWNGPLLAGNRLFLRNAEEMAAFDVALKEK